MRGIESRAWLLAIASAVLQVVIFPLPNLYMLCWIAITPLLVALLRSRRPDTLQLEGAVKLLPASPSQGFLLGYLCGILWYCGNCYWVYSTMKQYGGISAAGAAGLLLLLSLYLGLDLGFFWLAITLLARCSTSAALVSSLAMWLAVGLAPSRCCRCPGALMGLTWLE